MAAEGVILKNLKTTLDSIKNNQLLSSIKAANLKLKESLERIKGAVAALENDENHAIRDSLENLVDLLYQADDLLDVILIHTDKKRRRFPRVADQNVNSEEIFKRGLQRMISASSRIAQEISLFFPACNQLIRMGKGIEKIAQEIDELEGRRQYLYRAIGRPERPFWPYSYSLTRNEVIGRDKEKKDIVEMLLKPLKKYDTSVSIIPIVGPPGIGKSALAQCVYDDKKIKEHFDLRMWIQVSHMSDENEIIQEIVESCTNRSNNKRTPEPARLHNHVRQNKVTVGGLLGCQNFDTSITTPRGSHRKDQKTIYGNLLQKEIEGKLCLLILDDACITHGQRLKDLLAKGARGSWVLVTTQSNLVANFVKTKSSEPFVLGALSSDASWSLFEKFSLEQENPRKPERENELETLKQLGREIAENCGGVPLTIKVAASHLYKKNEEWLSFNNQLVISTNNGEDIMKHVLHSSYSDLPTRLKACCGYCSLFPDDYYFNKHDLISLWIAQGFINPHHGRSLETTAEKYFLELSRRCYFEDVITDDNGNIVMCKMHHIMRDLASQNSAGILSMYITDDPRMNLDSTCTHVSCDRDTLRTITSTKVKAQNLRTLILVNQTDSETKIGSLVGNMLISNFKSLRVLGLHDLGIEDLPDSIGKLIHLRYLDLSKNSLISLPQSVTELYNLQTLKLNSCTKLRRLPSNFGELVNLIRFEVDECDSLTCMPQGLERLTQLETLSRFVVGQDYSKEMANSGVKALKTLDKLRERLVIEFTGDWIATIPEASQAKLEDKIHLAELKISWRKTGTETSQHCLSNEDKSSYKLLLDQLQPHKDLKTLCIEGYKGQDFPIWAGVNTLTASLPKLVDISIEGCDECKHLPPFSKLEFLRRLTLRHMTNVEYMEGETLLESSPFFKSLEELTLHSLYKLERWREEVAIPQTQNEVIQLFPNLTKLRVRNCPNLRSMPLFLKIKDLKLHNVNQMLLDECARKASILVKQQPKTSSIEHLQIKEVPNLKTFEAVKRGLGKLPLLKHLVVERCDALCLLASELKHLTSLERLEISSCKELNLSDDGISTTGNFRTISRIPGRIVHRFIRNPWASLTHLRHLTLREIPKMETLPEGLKHVKSLRSLWISACTALTALPEWIGSLTSLQHLRIDSCQRLTRLPDGLKEVTSLMKVEITECSKLMDRCREHKGEDWHKIKHAQVFLHKSWRYGLMSELGASQNRSNVRALTDVKYFIIPVIAAEAEV